MAAHSLVDGRCLWQSDAGPVAGAFALSQEYIAYVSPSSELVLLDAATGETDAKIPGASPAVPPVLTRTSVLYAARNGLMVYAPSQAGSPTNPRRWMDTSWLGAVSSPMIKADSRVYVATDAKGLICAGKWR